MQRHAMPRHARFLDLGTNITIERIAVWKTNNA